MENINLKTENEPQPKDISLEFLSMNSTKFLDFLRTQRNEPFLSITIDWKDVSTARKLKAFLEDFDSIRKGQKRSAAIRATKEQYRQELNVFASGVKWEEV